MSKQFLTFATIICFAISALAAGRTGPQTIGLEGFVSDSVGKTSQVMSNCPANKECELPFLAYSFKNSNSRSSFDNPTTVIKQTLPNLNSNQRLWVTVYLDDGPNRRGHQNWTFFRKDLSRAEFWSKVADNSLLSDWQSRMVNPTKNWIQEMLNWASSNNYSNRIQFVVVPVLEDDAPSTTVYQKLISWTPMPFGTKFRRNGSTRVSGYPWEYHINNSFSIPSSLTSGDVISNDGIVVNGSQWSTIQQTALSRNATALLWRSNFNEEFDGQRNSTPPYQRSLSPFANSANVTSMISWLTTRYGY